MGRLCRHDLPVAIHIGDPEAFFLPIDRFNERFEELNAHPDWSFHGKDFPAYRESKSAVRVLARHPKTTVRGAARGTGENLADVGEISTSSKHVRGVRRAHRRARPADREPSGEFFDSFQDRILFGTDAVPKGDRDPAAGLRRGALRIYYRFLETEDEFFDYAPALVPPQGRWRIYGLGLPEQILRKVYHENAERVLGAKLVGR